MCFKLGYIVDMETALAAGELTWKGKRTINGSYIIDLLVSSIHSCLNQPSYPPSNQPSYPPSASRNQG